MSKHVLPFSTINSDYDFQIIAGVYFGYMTSLFVTYKSTVRHGTPYAAVGAGASFALSMMENLIDFTSVSRSELLATNVIASTKESVPGVRKVHRCCHDSQRYRGGWREWRPVASGTSESSNHSCAAAKNTSLGRVV